MRISPFLLLLAAGLVARLSYQMARSPVLRPRQGADAAQAGWAVARASSSPGWARCSVMARC